MDVTTLPTKLDSSSNPNANVTKTTKPNLARPQHRRSSLDPRDKRHILCHKHVPRIFTPNSSPQTTCTEAHLHPDKSTPVRTEAHLHPDEPENVHTEAHLHPDELNCLY
ncbi:unnamed protein product [Microthlaspi erraticum]|uniref:Uncharacterized protein n=1 Tax=Microthlaspi erraticum TaxID=1685480 RepID=A0A6D2HIQ6_9BRAS|nr:unnamed protein product [Microthlaspi erraticum]